MMPEWSESKEKRKKRLLSPHLAALAKKKALAHADGQCVFVGLYNQHCTAIEFPSHAPDYAHVLEHTVPNNTLSCPQTVLE